MTPDYIHRLHSHRNDPTDANRRIRPIFVSWQPAANDDQSNVLNCQRRRGRRMPRWTLEIHTYVAERESNAEHEMVERMTGLANWEIAEVSEKELERGCS